MGKIQLFNEENTVENLVRDILSMQLGWKFITRENLPRKEIEVLVETDLSDAIKKLNPEILDVPDRVDEIIYKLNSVIFSVNDIGLIKTNEEFSKWIKNEQSMPYGPGGQHIPIKIIEVCK